MATIRVRCKDSIFRGISGRMGDFVFRELKDETMLVFYQPKGKRAKDIPTLDREWTENGPIMDRFHEIARMFHLEVV